FTLPLMLVTEAFRSAPTAAPEAYWLLFTIVLFIVTAWKALATALAWPFTSPLTLSTVMLALVHTEFRLIWPLTMSLSFVLPLAAVLPPAGALPAPPVKPPEVGVVVGE